MTVALEELKSRLDSLPDVYPGFTMSALHSLEACGLVDEILELLDGFSDATTENVIAYEWLRCGLIDRYADDGSRMPVPCEWLALSSGMRGILADMRGKTLKSYQLALAGGDGKFAERHVRFNLGQYAVDLNCCDFTFEIGGKSEELAALHCEKSSLTDDFGSDPDAPVRAYAVGERVTGVELATDRIELNGGEMLDVDVAVAVRTAHATYTFARESWGSTGMRVVVSDGFVIPPEAGERNTAWLRARAGLSEAKAERFTTKLA